MSVKGLSSLYDLVMAEVATEGGVSDDPLEAWVTGTPAGEAYVTGTPAIQAEAASYS